MFRYLPLALLFVVGYGHASSSTPEELSDRAKEAMTCSIIYSLLASGASGDEKNEHEVTELALTMASRSWGARTAHAGEWGVEVIRTYLPVAPLAIRDNPKNQRMAAGFGIDTEGGLARDDEASAQQWENVTADCVDFIQGNLSEIGPLIEQFRAGREASAAESATGAQRLLSEPSPVELKAAFCVGVFRDQRDHSEEVLENLDAEASVGQDKARRRVLIDRVEHHRAIIRETSEREEQVNRAMARQAGGVDVEPLRLAFGRGGAWSISARVFSLACQQKCGAGAAAEKCHAQCMAENPMAASVAECSDLSFLSQ